MYASRHVVFVAPGRVDSELRRTLSIGEDISDEQAHAPRLLVRVESAAEAERITSALQERRHGSLVAGPEQPPVETGWRVAVAIESGSDGWRITEATGADLALPLAGLASLTVVDWRSVDDVVDRAVLLRFEGLEQPVCVRASFLPSEGLRRLAELLDACAQHLEPRVRLRSRVVSEGHFASAGLEGDLLPLALAMVDALDPNAGSLSRPLTARRPSSTVVSTGGTRRPLAALVTWAWWGGALASMPLVLWLLGSGGWMASLGGAATMGLGLIVAAWASQRLFWARWLERTTWGARAALPAWPLRPEESGRPPTAAGLGLEALLLGAAWLLRAGPHPTAEISAGLVWIAPVLWLLGLLGLWERAVALHWIEK